MTVDELLASGQGPGEDFNIPWDAVVRMQAYEFYRMKAEREESLTELPPAWDYDDVYIDADVLGFDIVQFANRRLAHAVVDGEQFSDAEVQDLSALLGGLYQVLASADGQTMTREQLRSGILRQLRSKLLDLGEDHMAYIVDNVRKEICEGRVAVLFDDVLRRVSALARVAELLILDQAEGSFSDGDSDMSE